VDRYLHGANVFIPDVLKHFDLPQVAAAVAGRRLVVLSPVDAMKQTVEAARARKAYRWTQQVYANLGAPERFRVAARIPEIAPANQYIDLLDTSSV
jgi:hypothetical protein